jgi:lipase
MILCSQTWPAADAAAPTVVCLPGITSTSHRFSRLARERLGDFDVVALDLRGHGESGWDPPWDIDTHLADIIETVGRPASWIGHSFGGRLIVELASRRPDLVKRAVLLDPAVHVRPQDALAQAEAVRRDQHYASLEEYVDSRLAGNTIFLAAREFLTEELGDDLRPSPDGDGLVPWFSRSAAVTGWSEMATASSPMPLCPTLVITAERSFMPYDAPPHPNLEVLIVPGGHSILWDAFEQVADATVSFLSANGS